MKSYCTFPQNGKAHFTLGIFVKTHGCLYKMLGHILKQVFFSKLVKIQAYHFMATSTHIFSFFQNGVEIDYMPFLANIGEGRK